MKKYNGYSNWETWNVILWLGNSNESVNKEWQNCKTKGQLVDLMSTHFPNGTPDMKENFWNLEPVCWEEVLKAKE